MSQRLTKTIRRKQSLSMVSIIISPHFLTSPYILTSIPLSLKPIFINASCPAILGYILPVIAKCGPPMGMLTAAETKDLEQNQ
jgi:hypothetical protein